MERSTLKVFVWFLVLVAFGLTWLAGYKTGRVAGTPAVGDTITMVRTDTLRDTVRVVEPQVVTERHVRTDTVRLPSVVRDSVFVEVPITQRQYADSTYRAWVSGYRPQLDSIEVYRRDVVREVTHTVTLPARRKRFSYGLQGGIGLTPKGVLPYVGVGAEWRW